MRACDQVLAFRHRVSVSISVSTSELGWEAFQPGGYPVVAFEAVSTVSWKGPQAGQGPSRSPGLLLDRGCQHRALRTFCTSWHYRATCSCQVSCPFWLHLSLCLSLHSLSSGPSFLPSFTFTCARPGPCCFPALFPNPSLAPVFILSPIFPSLSVFIGAWNFLVWHRLKA